MSRARLAICLLLLAALPLQAHAAVTMLACGMAGVAQHAAANVGDPHEMPCHEGKAKPPPPCAGCMECFVGASMAPPAQDGAFIQVSDAAIPSREKIPTCRPAVDGPYRPPSHRLA